MNPFIIPTPNNRETNGKLILFEIPSACAEETADNRPLGAMAITMKPLLDPLPTIDRHETNWLTSRNNKTCHE